MKMAHSRQTLVDIYRKRAKFYDISANLYYLIGFRELAYRRQAVTALNLQPGDTVVEIGCGTGLNFPLLQQAVGATGRIIGIDLTDAMLAQARHRALIHGWTNVDLVQSDAAEYKFPDNIGGILSTFAITLSPDYDQIIQRGARALASEKRCAILDLKQPDHVPLWLVRLGIMITKPFGVTLDQTSRHPWESVQRYLTSVIYKEYYYGFTFLAVGESPPITGAE